MEGVFYNLFNSYMSLGNTNGTWFSGSPMQQYLPQPEFACLVLFETSKSLACISFVYDLTLQLIKCRDTVDKVRSNVQVGLVTAYS